MPLVKAPQDHFTILYFAAAASHTNKDSEHVPAPVKLRNLFDVLDKRYPGMKAKVLTCCAITVNLEYVDVEPTGSEDPDSNDLEIQGGDEVAIIPPVSSG